MLTVVRASCCAQGARVMLRHHVMKELKYEVALLEVDAVHVRYMEGALAAHPVLGQHTCQNDRIPLHIAPAPAVRLDGHFAAVHAVADMLRSVWLTLCVCATQWSRATAASSCSSRCPMPVSATAAPAARSSCAISSVRPPQPD